MDRPIYLDYAATTPVDPRVAKVMMRYLMKEDCFGNPSSVTHVYGQEAKKVVDLAREQVAALIQAQASEIIFTSCATESINTAIKGIAKFYHRRGKHIITLKTEHPAVIKTCEALERDGYEISYLTPLFGGLMDFDLLKETLRDDTVLVSVMHVNNEVGVIQDIERIGELVKSRGAFFHVDAVQSVGKLAIDVNKMHADLMSFSGHKLYAPKGVGVLYVRQHPKIHLEPLIHGAKQENNLRAGTLAVHQIVAIGEAFVLANEYLPKADAHYQLLRQVLLDNLKDLPGWLLNGDVQHCHPSIVNISFDKFTNQQLVQRLSGLAISTGSACTTGSLEPSPVLRAIGVPIHLAKNAIRISFGRETTVEEVEQAAGLIEASL